FAASYSTTAKKTYDERALYAAGVPWRMTVAGTDDIGLDGKGVDAGLAALPGVERGSAVIRTTGSPATTGTTARVFQVLGVDPDQASTMLWFRSDFANQPLKDLMGELGAPRPLTGKVLPPGTNQIKVMVNTNDPRGAQTLWLRVADKDQYYDMLELGKPEGAGWQQMTATVNRNFEGQLPEPLTIMSI